MQHDTAVLDLDLTYTRALLARHTYLFGLSLCREHDEIVLELWRDGQPARGQLARHHGRLDLDLEALDQRAAHMSGQATRQNDYQHTPARSRIAPKRPGSKPFLGSPCLLAAHKTYLSRCALIHALTRAHSSHFAVCLGVQFCCGAHTMRTGEARGAATCSQRPLGGLRTSGRS